MFLNNFREVADRYHITPEHFEIGSMYLDWRPFRQADLVISPDGEPYLFRWHVVPSNKHANVYLHVQVRDDPERPLHDHPWDNQSVMLAGGYLENYMEPSGTRWWRFLEAGNTVAREAELAHRLVLPYDVPYAMTLFTTGPKRRPWGFWYPDGWVDADEVCRREGNVTIHAERKND